MSEFMQGVQQGAQMAALRFQMQREEERLQEQIRARMEATRLREQELIEQRGYNQERLSSQKQYYDYQTTQEERRFLAEKGRLSKYDTDRMNKDEEAALERIQRQGAAKESFDLLKSIDPSKTPQTDTLFKLAEIQARYGFPEDALKLAQAAKLERSRGASQTTKEYIFKDDDTGQAVSLSKAGFIQATKSAIDRLKSKLMLQQSKTPSGKQEIKVRDDEVTRLREEIKLRERELERVIGQDVSEYEETETDSEKIRGKVGNATWELIGE